MTNISQKRLTAFAERATTFGHVQGNIAALRMICRDRATLQRENRRTAMAGAERILAVGVRRLCATATSSREDSEAKVAVLARFKNLYHGGNGAETLLVGAMIDAAITLETEAWPASSSKHGSPLHP